MCLLHQHEQLRDYKELGDIRDSLLSKELVESDELILISLQAQYEKELFNCSLKIKKLLSSSHPSESTPVPGDCKGVKLPKINVPKSDCNIVNWRTFWKFHTSIHSRSNLSDSEKLVYLRLTERWFH